MEEIVVSVVICSFNRVKLLERTINSILQQNISFPIEILIGDDGSTDGSKQLCIDYKNKYPKIFKLYFNAENYGLGKNWASLAKNAIGKYIANCDDDDYWHNPDKIRMQVDFLNANPEYSMVHTEINHEIFPSERIINDIYKNRKIEIISGNILEEVYYGKLPICVSSSMICRNALMKFVPLDLYINMSFNIQDWPTWMFLSKYSKIGYLSISTTTYRIGDIAISNIIKFDMIERKVEKDQEMYRVVTEHFPDNFAYNETDYNQYKLKILLSYCYKKFNFKNSKSYIKKYWNGNDYDFKIKCGANVFSFYVLATLLFLKKKFYPFSA